MADIESILRQIDQHLSAGRFEPARGLVHRALQKSPNDADLNSSMCFILQKLGQVEQAMHFGQRALAARPNDLRFVENIANIFGLAGRHVAAAEVLERVVAAEPHNANAWNTLCAAYFLSGNLASAESTARRALELHPRHPRLMEQLSAVARKHGRSAEAYSIVKEASLAHPEDTDLAHETAFNSNYPSGVPAREVFDAHRRFGELWCSKVKRIALPRPSPADADRPLRVAFMSPDLRQHSVAHYAEPVIAGLDRSRFNLFVYFIHPKPDDITARFRALVPPANWCDGVHLPDDVLAQRVAFDKIDILVDLTGLTGGARAGVLARKPAHLQVNYLGYPNTVGLPTMDYRFIDSITDPPGVSDTLAVERLVRLDPCFLCFRPPANAPEVGPPPMLSNGFVTFGSFNAGLKFSDSCIAMWSNVLNAVPSSRLFLKNFDLALPEPREHLYSRFEKHGIARDRIEMQAFTATIPEHLRLYQKVDIGLDTFPYHGTTTTCEAFHMGIPVVSLEGSVHAARVGSSLLHAVGLPELIARSEDAFVKIASELAGNPARIASIRASLRDRQAKGTLGDEAGFAARFGDTLRHLWRNYCAGGSG
ncbi:MAG: tetratricopeptide repeat protein [Phycisphaerae bacterium]|nr:tetratricopeptide repeat protein [Phycisphaerae bacterium]